MSAGVVPSEGHEEWSVSGLSHSFWWFAGIFMIPMLVDTSPRPLPPFSPGVLPVCLCVYVCVQIFPFHKDPRPFGLGPTLITSDCLRKDPVFK